MHADPSGYTYGRPEVPESPVTMSQLDELKQSVLWSAADEAALRRAGAILVPQTEAILDVWYGFVGSHPHLVATFAGKDGAPSMEYLGAVRQRFARWIDDLCNRPYDETWLAYQEEIGRRHHPSGKNRTDRIESTSKHIPLRDLIGFISPITLTIRPFLHNGATSADDAQEMHDAWLKAITLTVALWARPYNDRLW
ncbi:MULTISPECIES: protoglobin domain-containing protein [Microbacterium]|uniref:protoglobin domain-containing protein n=1 Tax=Microbacterium TaxID=33882 RepID=UPI000629AE89|nr:protoglobin domain-containing protein [Microbacterium sp. Ag1]KKX98546.1 protogloblin ApPgb [Microbacterium sp. Ag1]